METEQKAQRARCIAMAQWLRWVDDVVVQFAQRQPRRNRDEIVRALEELRRVEQFYGRSFDAAQEIDAQARIFDALQRLASEGLDTLEIEAGLMTR